MNDSALATVPAGPGLPEWRLVLSIDDHTLFDTETAHRVQFLVAVACVVIFAISALSIIVVRSFRTQVKLARLKNDLVANVSHELKTPLTAMRALVDTLVDTERLDEKITREYLQLIAAENARATAGDRSSWNSVVGTARRRPRSAAGDGIASLSADRTWSSNAQSATDFASGPAESSESDSGRTPSSGTRRAVGLNPTMPFSAAGMRTDPPVSEPIAAAAMPSVTEIAAPDDDPPGTRPAARSNAFLGVP